MQIEFCSGNGLSLDNIVLRPIPPAAVTSYRPKMPRKSENVASTCNKSRAPRTIVVKTVQHKLPPTEDILKLPAVVRHVNIKVCEAKREMINKWQSDCIERDLKHNVKIDDIDKCHARKVPMCMHTHVHG